MPGMHFAAFAIAKAGRVNRDARLLGSDSQPGLNRKTPLASRKRGFEVEMQGFEPWSRQGNRRAFYVRIYAWIFMAVQAHIRPLHRP
ncbi:hypothetical protein AUC43_00790 [Hymenobacter sedentarius]|uniref:Uncharacterized protein n=1 Tax=Hymenobacter sedentarius TaxID=1411621 RepID=A0A0U4C0S1_9BACT|nr:hypothetical protein AUC43_00790 [Hymenobacter sedentarius]